MWDLGQPVIVVKVGGSLYDLPDLGPRLRSWLDQLETKRVLLVPGGGPLSDAVRQLDHWQQLGEETSHWLALLAMRAAGKFLIKVLPGAEDAVLWPNIPDIWERGQTPILDAYCFGVYDDHEADRLPHSWDVTSDSIAAKAAVRGGASRLVLLKSTSLPDGIDWTEAARRGLVDAYFPRALQGSSFAVQWVNFR
jgi:aspartokinase-like uncharacterized kinase